MNVLYDLFPQSVCIEEQKYRIITDFREWIRLQELVKDDTVPPEYKVKLLMQWYIDLPDNIEKALLALGDFLKAKEISGFTGGGKSSSREKESDGQTGPAFSYSEDAACIFCGFMECYGIDLETIPYMHWWKFRMLFEGLKEETEIKQRIHYRLIDINTIKDKEERKRIKRIKRAVALKAREKSVDDFEIGDVFS